MKKDEQMKVFSLASGSKGNCTFVKFGQTAILIDAGISFERIKKRLEQEGESVFEIKAILISHEHSDHVCGLETFVKKVPNVKIFAHEEVCKVLGVKNKKLLANLVPIKLPFFYVDDLTISTFIVPHDSVACFGFCVLVAGKKFAICTDCGVWNLSVLESLFDADLIFVESNHSEKMLLENTDYSKKLKDRILSKGGHLSNKSCGELLCEILKKRQEENLQNPTVVLCHQSQNTNSQDVLRREVGAALAKSNFDVNFFVATQEYGTMVFLV